ncbi:MAG TPA: hypothetical protein VGG39_36465 [Polyangiaceae bacterium]
MISTRVAKHLYGENLYFGHRSLGDLLGTESMTGLVAMGVAGAQPTREQREVLDAIAVIVNSADPRIWPLKLTRLVSSYGSVMAGYCAGQLAVEGERIGYWVTGYAAAALAELRTAVGDRIDDDAAVDACVRALVARRGRVLGFGVPLRPSDERMDALSAYAQARGLDRGVHWRLMDALAGHLEKDKGVPRNICIGLAAVLLDMGYAPEQTSRLAHFLSQSVFVANACEAATQQSPEMQRLPPEHVEYAGAPRRESPRALARRHESSAPAEYMDDGLPCA